MPGHGRVQMGVRNERVDQQARGPPAGRAPAGAAAAGLHMGAGGGRGHGLQVIRARAARSTACLGRQLTDRNPRARRARFYALVAEGGQRRRRAPARRLAPAPGRGRRASARSSAAGPSLVGVIAQLGQSPRCSSSHDRGPSRRRRRRRGSRAGRRARARGRARGPRTGRGAPSRGGAPMPAVRPAAQRPSHAT